MKKYIVTIALSLVGFGSFTGCTSNDEYLKENTYGKVFPDNFYNNQAELDLAANAMYRKLSRIFFSDHERFSPALTGADDVAGHFDPEFKEFEIFQATQGNGDMKIVWEECYSTINTANGIINNYKNATGNVSENDLLAAAGEAHFIRAYVYFWLTRVFDRVPIITTSMEVDEKREVRRASREEIYAFIIDDLKKAEEWLPRKWSGHKANGGITKGAAIATLASVYLTKAGYPLKDNNAYALARDKAKEIIDNESTYGYRLLDNYADIWSPAYDTHDETLFSLYYNKTVDEGNMRNPLAGKPKEFGGWELYSAEINFFNKFPEGERKKATFVTDFEFNDGTKKTWEQMDFRHPYYGKNWADSPSFSWSRMWESEDWRSNRPNYMIRYAEVLLIYAEAQAMADGAPNELAYECVNRVRNRAFKGVGTTEANLTTGLSAIAFRDSVVAERAWEFAGLEFAARWFDLVRLEKVEEVAADRHEWELPIPEAPTKQKYFVQIPTAELLLNPGLGEN